jgi:hypothetical protein
VGFGRTCLIFERHCAGGRCVPDLFAIHVDFVMSDRRRRLGLRRLGPLGLPRGLGRLLALRRGGLLGRRL